MKFPSIFWSSCLWAIFALLAYWGFDNTFNDYVLLLFFLECLSACVWQYLQREEDDSAVYLIILCVGFVLQLPYTLLLVLPVKFLACICQAIDEEKGE